MFSYTDAGTCVFSLPHHVAHRDKTLWLDSSRFAGISLKLSVSLFVVVVVLFCFCFQLTCLIFMFSTSSCLSFSLVSLLFDVVAFQYADQDEP